MLNTKPIFLNIDSGKLTVANWKIIILNIGKSTINHLFQYQTVNNCIDMKLWWTPGTLIKHGTSPINGSFFNVNIIYKWVHFSSFNVKIIYKWVHVLVLM